MSTAGAAKNGSPRWLLQGILPFDMARFPLELVAGATLAALAIPEVMGYAAIAGMPAVTGLYTLLLPVLAFALLGSSRHLVVGADSATAAILAAGLLAVGATAQSPEYAQMASLAALMCGAFLLLARVLRLGFIANFLSRSVLVGFLTGVGIQVAMGQVGGMFGIGGQTGGTIEKFLETLRAIPSETSLPTLAVSLAVLATILGLGRVDKKVPGALIAVVGAIVLSYLLDLAAEGVSVLGTVTPGLPALSLPTDVINADNIVSLIPLVVAMVVVILAQSAATSRAYAMKYNDRFDENVDIVGLSAASFGAGITGTFVINGSPTKTEMVDGAGGRNQLAQLTAGAIVVVVLLFLTNALSYMPNAVLAAVVFLIGLRLIDYRGMDKIRKLRPGEFAVAAITAAVVVMVGVEQGIILAMFLSILEHIYHSYKPYDTVLRENPAGPLDYEPVTSGTQARPGLAIFRFGATLYYANSAEFTKEIMSIADAADPPLAWLGLSGASMGDIDYTGADAVRQVHEQLSARGITFAMCDLSPNVMDLATRYELTEKVGVENIYPSVRRLIEAFDGRLPASGPGAGPADSTTPQNDSEAQPAPE